MTSDHQDHDIRLAQLDARIRAARKRIAISRELRTPHRDRATARATDRLQDAERQRTAHLTARAAREAADQRRRDEIAWASLHNTDDGPCQWPPLH